MRFDFSIYFSCKTSKLIQNLYITQFATIINESLDLHFPSSDVQVIAEPGRYHVQSAFTIVCQVHSKRDVEKDGKLDSIEYYINEGIYGSFNSVHFNIEFPPFTLKSEEENIFKSTIWGCSMDTADLVTPFDIE